MTRKVLIAISIVASLGTLGVATLARPGAPVAAPVAPSVGGREGVIAGPGRVEPVSEEIAVAPELPGRLAEVLVDEGDVVRRGQVLARLVGDEYAARLAAAEARLAMAEAERDRLVNGARAEERREARDSAAQADAALAEARSALERKRLLLPQGLASVADFERAERDARVAEARRDELDQRAVIVAAAPRSDDLARATAAVALAGAQAAEARALLDKTSIRSPIDGVVLRRHRRAGESVALNAPSPATIVTVADTRTLRVRVEVDESDVARVRVGQRAWVTADAYGVARFGARVERVSPMLGRKQLRTDAPIERVDTKVLETLVELDPGVRLPVGLRVDAFIATR
jgi:multidrug resistance efflux pump